MEGIKKNLEERSKKTISVLKEDLNTVRAGRANPALLDKVMVECYGTPTPLEEPVQYFSSGSERILDDCTI